MKTAGTFCATILVTGVAAFASSGAVAAEHVAEERVVMFADLNLNHPAGVQALYARIRGAARSVCLAAVGRAPILGSLRRDCTRDALANAVESLNDHRLNAYYSERTGADRAETIARR